MGPPPSQNKKKTNLPVLVRVHDPWFFETHGSLDRSDYNAALCAAFRGHFQCPERERSAEGNGCIYLIRKFLQHQNAIWRCTSPKTNMAGNGKSPCSMGNASSNGGIFIAMLVFFLGRVGVGICTHLSQSAWILLRNLGWRNSSSF